MSSSNFLGLTTRFTVTATTLGTRKDVANRRVATDLGAVSEFEERTVVLTPNNSGGSNEGSRRVLETVSAYLLVHSDSPLLLTLVDADDNSLSVSMASLFLATTSFKSVTIVNPSLTDSASVSIICA